MKGKNTIHIARKVESRARGLAGQNFGARGNSVTTVEQDEKVRRECIRKQEYEDKQMEKLKFRLQAVLKAILSGLQTNSSAFAEGG